MLVLVTIDAKDVKVEFLIRLAYKEMKKDSRQVLLAYVDDDLGRAPADSNELLVGQLVSILSMLE